MIIGFDLDGFISKKRLFNPSLPLPQCMCILLAPIFLLVKPNLSVISILKSIKLMGHEIIIISARSNYVFNLTKKWLEKNNVPFEKLICVGIGKGTKERKLEAIQREKAVFFFDDNERVVAYLRENSVRASTHL